MAGVFGEDFPPDLPGILCTETHHTGYIISSFWGWSIYLHSDFQRQAECCGPRLRHLAHSATRSPGHTSPIVTSYFNLNTGLTPWNPLRGELEAGPHSCGKRPVGG